MGFCFVLKEDQAEVNRLLLPNTGADGEKASGDSCTEELTSSHLLLLFWLHRHRFQPLIVC